MKKLIAALCCVYFLAVPATTTAAGFKAKITDTLVSVLRSHKDERVTVRLDSGGTLTGVVRMVNINIVQLGELSGKEFYDTVIDINDIEAVVMRVK